MHAPARAQNALISPAAAAAAAGTLRGHRDTTPPIVFLQCAMAPSMALWSSSIDDDDAADSDTGRMPMLLVMAAAAAAGTSGKPTPPAPPKESIPEWFGDDRIDDGQLAAHRF